MEVVRLDVIAGLVGGGMQPGGWDFLVLMSAEKEEKVPSDN